MNLKIFSKLILFSLVFASKETSALSLADAFGYVKPQVNPIEALVALSPLGRGLIRYCMSLGYKSLVACVAEKIFSLPRPFFQTINRNRVLTMAILCFLLCSKLAKKCFQSVKRTAKKHLFATRLAIRLLVQFATDIGSVKTTSFINKKVQDYKYRFLCMILPGLAFPMLSSFAEQTIKSCVCH